MITLNELFLSAKDDSMHISKRSWFASTVSYATTAAEFKKKGIAVSRVFPLDQKGIFVVHILEPCRQVWPGTQVLLTTEGNSTINTVPLRCSSSLVWGSITRRCTQLPPVHTGQVYYCILHTGIAM